MNYNNQGRSAMSTAGDIFALAKEDLVYMVKDIPKWKLAVLAGLAVLFVKGRRKTRWLALAGLGFMGYHTLEPYFHELEMRARYGQAFRGQGVQGYGMYGVQGYGGHGAHGGQGTFHSVGYREHQAIGTGDGSGWDGFGVGNHHYVPHNQQGQPGQYQGNAWYR